MLLVVFSLLTCHNSLLAGFPAFLGRRVRTTAPVWMWQASGGSGQDISLPTHFLKQPPHSASGVEWVHLVLPIAYLYATNLSSAPMCSESFWHFKNEGLIHKYTIAMIKFTISALCDSEEVQSQNVTETQDVLTLDIHVHISAMPHSINFVSSSRHPHTYIHLTLLTRIAVPLTSCSKAQIYHLINIILSHKKYVFPHAVTLVLKEVPRTEILT